MAKDTGLTLIKLDRTRELRYGHKALKMMQTLTGKSLSDFSMADFDLNELEKVLYCGLLSDARRNNEELKLEQMEDLLDEAESFQYIVEKMEEAFSNAFGSGEEGKN
jgi:hypothetical protein